WPGAGGGTMWSEPYGYTMKPTWKGTVTMSQPTASGVPITVAAGIRKPRTTCSSGRSITEVSPSPQRHRCVVAHDDSEASAAAARRERAKGRSFFIEGNVIQRVSAVAAAVAGPRGDGGTGGDIASGHLSAYEDGE